MTKVVNAVRKVEKKFVGELKKSSVGRSLARVIEPLLDGKAKVDDEIGRFGRSKLGKAVVMAVAIYFGGAALSGAMAGSAAGTGALAGAGTGLSGAWTSLGTAANATMAGNFTGAGSALSAGYGGTAVTGAELAASQAANAGTLTAAGGSGGAAATAGAVPAASSATTAAAPSAWATSPTGLNVLASEAAPTVAANAAQNTGGGMLSNFFSNPRNTPALLQAGSGMLGSMAQANQQKAMYQMENEKQEDMRRRYGANIGTRLWSAPPTAPVLG